MLLGRFKRFTLVVGGSVALALTGCSPTPSATATNPGDDTAPAPQAAPSDRVSDLVAAMTVEEKLGQLHQAAGGRSKNLNSRLTPEELDRVRRGGVGSYLHVAGAAPLLELQRVAVEESRLGIPLLFSMDVVHGYRTIFPVPLAMASSWAPEDWTQAARISAVEATAAGLHWTFAPMIDVARDPRWGRIVEGAGADPYLGSRMAVAQVQGYQGTDLSDATTMLATAKHFGAYGAPLGGRDYGTAEISERELQQTYLPPFYAVAKEAVGSMMIAFNDIGGVPSTGNERLIDGILRGQWGWEGVILSDWNAIAELIAHGVAADRSGAGALALRAGVDMDMTSQVFVTDLAAALDSDPALTADLDLAVTRILAAKEKLGLFDDPYAYHDTERESAVMLAEDHRAAARSLAARSMVLLKNDGDALPIQAGAGRIAVIGGLAEDTLTQLGSWRARGQAADVVSILDGLRAHAPDGVSIDYAMGARPQDEGIDGIAQAVQLATQSDHVLLVIGEDYDLSGEARSRSQIELPTSQAALAEAIFATGTPVTVLLVTGRPMAIPTLDAQAQAILLTWISGVEAGNAVADLVYGKASPGGRLPANFPRRTGQVPFTYTEYPGGRPADPDPARDTNRYMDLPITPLYPFGHGLTYGQVSYGALVPSATQMGPDGDIALSLDVTNGADRAVDEVVQLYMRDPVASVARPKLELRGFRRVRLEPGQTRTVTFTVAAAQAAIFDANQAWMIEAGELLFHAGASAGDLRSSAAVTITHSHPASAPAAALAAKVDVQ